MAISGVLEQRMRERRFFLWAAIFFPLIVLAGFGRTYYLKAFFGAPPLASVLVHIHGAVMTAWVALFIAQIWLVRSRNIKIHQKLGLAGVALGILILIVGFFTAVASGKYGSASTPPDIPPLQFMVVPIFDLIVFAILFGAAIYYRRRPDNHKRLMLLTVLNFLPPALGRLPIASLQQLGPLLFFGVPDLLAIVLLGYDTWKNRRLNRAFAIGTAVLILSHPLRLMLSGTGAWMQFAVWVTS